VVYAVEITDSTKLELERLQAEILIKTNKKFTQQELIDILIDFGREHMENLLKILSSKFVTQEDFNRIRSLSSPWGIETTPELNEEILYGGNA
jgi:hypothetical protein